MNNLSTHIGTLEHLERMPNSRNGNPRYRAYIAGVNFVTAVDSMHGYELPNFEGKRVCVTIGTHYGRATLKSIKGAE